MAPSVVPPDPADTSQRQQPDPRQHPDPPASHAPLAVVPRVEATTALMSPAQLRAGLRRPLRAVLDRAQVPVLVGLSVVALGSLAGAVLLGGPWVGSVLAAVAVAYPAAAAVALLAGRSLGQPPNALWTEHLRRTGQAPMHLHEADARKEHPAPATVVLLRCEEDGRVAFTRLVHGPPASAHEPSTAFFVRHAGPVQDPRSAPAAGAAGDAGVASGRGPLTPRETLDLSEWLLGLSGQNGALEAPERALAPGAGTRVRVEVGVLWQERGVVGRWTGDVRRAALEQEDHAVALLWRLVEGAGQRRHRLGVADGWPR